MQYAYEDYDLQNMNKVQVMSAFGSNIESSERVQGFSSAKDKAVMEMDENESPNPNDIAFFPSSTDNTQKNKHVRTGNAASSPNPNTISLPATIKEQYNSMIKSIGPSLEHLDQTFAKVQD